MVMEDDSPAEPASGLGTLRNLLAWSINIPHIHSYDDELKREKIPVFCIDVERHDRKEGENNDLKNRRQPQKSPWQHLTHPEDTLISLELSSRLSQWVIRQRGGPLTDDIWNSTFWSPDLQSSTVTFNPSRLMVLTPTASRLLLMIIGTFVDAQLPSKRLIGPKNYEFLVSKREEFEAYLQVFDLRTSGNNLTFSTRCS